MDAFVNWLNGLGDRLTDFFVRHAMLLKDPESMTGLFIVTMWAVFAGAFGGWLAILIILLIAWTLHIAAVETGSHVVLWLTTAALLILIVLSSTVTFDGLSPVFLAAAGTTALLYNELVRLNYTRRRNAIVHDEVYHASGVALAAVAAMAIIGTSLAAIAGTGSERTWLWMPAAVGVLMLIGFGLSIGPTRGVPKSSTKRWQPGERIPPQPLGDDELERF